MFIGTKAVAAGSIASRYAAAVAVMPMGICVRLLVVEVVAVDDAATAATDGTGTMSVVADFRRPVFLMRPKQPKRVPIRLAAQKRWIQLFDPDDMPSPHICYAAF